MYENRKTLKRELSPSQQDTFCEFDGKTVSQCELNCVGKE